MHPNIFRRDIEKMLKIIVCEMVDALKRDEAIEIRGWGIIKTVVRKARTGRNPKNSESILIPEKKAIVPKRQSPIKWIGFLPTRSDSLPIGNNIALIARDSAKMTH